MAKMITDPCSSSGSAEGEEASECGSEEWVAFADGSSGRGGSGAGIIIRGNLLFLAVLCRFEATNNVAEYEAVLKALRLARSIGIRRLVVFTDSQLVVNQVSGSFEARDPRLSWYLQIVKGLSL